ncbi:acyl-CoA desaturase [soil metagenome]
MPTPERRLSLGGRIGTFVGITIPLLGVIAAPFFVWGWGFHWLDLALFAGMYLATVFGVTIGFHRLLVHRSFETFMPVKFAFAAIGSMAFEGPVLKWVALHRRHHQHSDTPDDVHSPHHGGPGILGFLRGFWHAHIGWAFKADPLNLDHYIKDLTSSPALRTVNRLFPLWAFLGFAIPTTLGGLISGTWEGALTGFIWGGLVRVCVVHHVTWSINSACHLWGRKPFRCEDESRNNLVFGYLAMGEGWHNNHHAFPTSARHGLHWWEIDVSYWIIRSLQFTGLAWNVKVPTQEMQERQRCVA